MTSPSTVDEDLVNRIAELEAELTTLKKAFEEKPYPGCKVPHQPASKSCGKSSCPYYGVKTCLGCWDHCPGKKEAWATHLARAKTERGSLIDPTCEGWECSKVDPNGGYHTIGNSHRVVWLCRECLRGRW